MKLTFKYHTSVSGACRLAVLYALMMSLFAVTGDRAGGLTPARVVPRRFESKLLIIHSRINFTASARGTRSEGRTMERFENKVALITGGATGIGLATARRFAQEGAKVVIASRNEAAGEQAVYEIRASGGEATFVRTDVTQEAQIEALITRTVETHGKIDAAFNNAGTEGIPAPLADDNQENYQNIFEVNVRGLWLSMRHQLKHMQQHSTGSIVNNASIAGLIGFPGLGLYTASKHAVLGLTKAAALENAEIGIRVNAVSPAMIETDMAGRILSAQPGNKEDTIASMKSMHPIGRFGKPEEISSAVTWLCSDDASFVVGQSLTVDGGFTAI